MFNFLGKLNGYSASRHLRNKKMMLIVTNACNLTCGGCNQLCGNFESGQIWHISRSDFRKGIEALIAFADRNWRRTDFPAARKYIGIYGGEPTMHPQWEQLVSIMLEYKDYPFVVYTNGYYHERELEGLEAGDDSTEGRRRLWQDIQQRGLPKSGYPQFSRIFESFHAHDRNICYRIDYKNRHSKISFQPVLVAPADYMRECGWKEAQGRCYHWKNCEAGIYNDKAYFCTVAGALDHMFNQGMHGWELDGERTFERSAAEIESQAANFCYRCGYNFGEMEEVAALTGVKQLTCEKSLASRTNSNIAKSSRLRILG